MLVSELFKPDLYFDFSSTGFTFQYHHNCLPEHGWFSCPVNDVINCIKTAQFPDSEDCNGEGNFCGNECDKPTFAFQSLT